MKLVYLDTGRMPKLDRKYSTSSINIVHFSFGVLGYGIYNWFYETYFHICINTL